MFVVCSVLDVSELVENKPEKTEFIVFRNRKQCKAGIIFPTGNLGDNLVPAVSQELGR